MQLNHLWIAPKIQFLIKPNAFDVLLPLLPNVVFEGDRLTQPCGGNVQVLHQQQHAPKRDVEQPNNKQIDLLQQSNVVENEQPNIDDNNADLQVINPQDLDVELEEEQASS